MSLKIAPNYQCAILNLNSKTACTPKIYRCEYKGNNTKKNHWWKYRQTKNQKSNSHNNEHGGNHNPTK